MKKLFIIFGILPTLLFSQVERPAYNTGTGFFVKDGKVYDADGYEFIMRGVNHNHYWGNETENLNAADEIPKSKANCVRVVMADQDWVTQSNTPAKKRMLVEKYINNGIIPMVELHDGTCEGSASYIEDIVDSWTLPDNVDLFNEYEEFIILNIANEWGPANSRSDLEYWRDTYKDAVTNIRDAGINNLICIDSPGCGQNPRGIHEFGQELIDHDPQKNIVLSIHMYGRWRSESTGSANDPSNDNGPWSAEATLQMWHDMGLPIIVGEFSWTGGDSPEYDTKDVIKVCNELGLGWLAWSWNGNGDDKLDMVKGWKYDSDDDLKEYGELIINHPLYGLRATANPSTAFDEQIVRPFIELDTPMPGDSFQPDQTIHLVATAMTSEGSIDKVSFFANDELIGTDDTAPYEVDWQNVPRGKYMIYASAYGSNGFIQPTEPFELLVGGRPQTMEALIIAGTSDLRNSENLIKERLEIMGFNVSHIDDNDCQSSDADGKDLIFISPYVSGGKVKDKFTNITVPVFVGEYFVFDDFKLTGPTSKTDYGTTVSSSVNIVNASHPLSAGLSGTVNITADEEKMSWGIPAAGAIKIAEHPGEENAYSLFAYETGAQMVEITAPARRVAFFIDTSTPENMSQDGWRLFDAAVDWLVGLDTSVKNEPKIVESLELFQNYPNPFNPKTTIKFALQKNSRVTLNAYNLKGELVESLTSKNMSAGEHQIIWNASNHPSGMYFLGLNAAGEQKMIKCTLLK